MDFRRIPFQFSTADPVKRQEELQRRFGLPANKSNMFVDFANPGAMGTSSASNSPRLQHRVPIFVEGQSEPSKPSVDGQNVDSGRKPHVRVIPIEIEGEDNINKKHRWNSGSVPIKERFDDVSVPVKTVKHSVPDTLPQSSKAPRICNIPINIEGNNHEIKTRPIKTQKGKSPVSPNHAEVKLNGCSVSKVAKVNEKTEPPKTNETKESPEQSTLKKIESIEEKLKGYHADVEKFSGTNKEKQYRYLDEMLTRCMLELDEIDTMGLDTIRLARKAAVKKVQASVDLLELKTTNNVSEQDQVLKEQIKVEISADVSSGTADMEIEGAEVKETESGTEETVPVITDVHDHVSAGEKTTNISMSDVLPEKDSEKVENISIMETESDIKPDDKESNIENLFNEPNITDEKLIIEVTQPIQITEIDAGENIVASESHPVVEEPLSDSKDDNAVDMEVDSSECDLMLDEASSVQISEVENDSAPNLNDLELGTNEHSDLSHKTEVTETSNIPVIAETVSFKTQAAVSANESTALEQSTISIDSNDDSASICSHDIPTNS